MAFLLIAPRKTIEGEMSFRLAMVWVYPHQAQLSSLDEAAKILTLLINLGNNWAYAFVLLNEDAQHVPLSNVQWLMGCHAGVHAGASANSRQASSSNVGTRWCTPKD